MKNRFLSITVAVLLIGMLILTGCGMKDLPQGELIGSSDSPDGAYRVNAYLCNGGATVDYAIRCEAVNVGTGATRNIFWSYHQYEAQIDWLDDRTVVINGVPLDVTKDSYDWRKK